MFYPRDLVTQSELYNNAITPNGFYLDLANSKYLQLSIVREVLKDGATGLSEDVRFNRSAKDGDSYSDEGIDRDTDNYAVYKAQVKAARALK